MSDTVRPLNLVDAATDSLKVPPHSLEPEQSVLGGLMLDNQSWDDVADQIVEEDFYRHDHRVVFRAIARLVESSQPLDVVTLSEHLEHCGELDDVGGLAYLGALAKETPSAANIRAYAKIVRERSILRQLIHAGTEIANSGYQPAGKDIKDLLDGAEQRVFDIAEQGGRIQHGFVPVNKLLSATIDRIETLYQQEGTITGLATGFVDFDEKTSGLQPADLVIVAGRPSMGKTTFAMNIAEHAAISGKKPVAIFSMEMPGDQLVLRMISSLGRVNSHHLRTGSINEDDWPRITSAISLLSEASLFIDDSPALTPTDIRARSRRLMREHGQLGLIVVDYLQLMRVPGTAENRATEISEISRSLNALAKELKTPVMAVSQLNRSLEQRQDKRPVMSDLRESGAIEQDADLIAFIYRDEVYNEDTPDQGKAEIIIGKQRNGPIGTNFLTFRGEYTRFDNFATNDYYSNENA